MKHITLSMGNIFLFAKSQCIDRKTFCVEYFIIFFPIPCLSVALVLRSLAIQILEIFYRQKRLSFIGRFCFPILVKKVPFILPTRYATCLSDYF